MSLPNIEIKPSNTNSALMDNCVLMLLNLGKLGNRKKVSSNEVEVNADKDYVKVSKVLLDSEELKLIEQCQNNLRAYVAGRCLPSSFKAGMYLLPMPLVEEVEARFDMFHAEHDVLVREFVSVYDTRVSEAKTNLGALYNITDYPSRDYVAASFYMRRSYMEFAVDSKLEKFSPKLFKQQQEQLFSEWQQAEQAVISALRANALDLVSHLVERMGVDSDGKKHIFRNSSVEKLREFIEIFQYKNVTQDVDLADIITQCQCLMEGVDPESIRTDDALRESLTTGFKAVKNNLSDLMTTTGAVTKRRGINLANLEETDGGW